jgi:hypothetical protein
MIVLAVVIGVVAVQGGEAAEADGPGVAFDRLDATFRENLERMPEAGLIRFSHRYDDSSSGSPFPGMPGPSEPNEDLGLYAFDGPLGYFEQSAPEEVLRARFFPIDEGARWAGSPSRTRALTDGRVTLLDRRIPGSAPALGDQMTPGSGVGPGLEPGASGFSDLIFLPLIGRGGQGGLADVASQSGMDREEDGPWADRVIRLDPDASLDGLPVVAVTLELPGGLMQLWVDPDRGAIPVRVRVDRARPPVLGPDGGIVTRAKNYATQLDFEEIRQLPGGAWLPFREVVSTADSADGSAPPERFRTTSITEANFDEPPPRSMFRVEYAEPNLPRIRGDRPAPTSPRLVWDLDAIAAIDPGSLDPPILRPTLPGDGEEVEALWPFGRSRDLTAGLVVLSLLTATLWVSRRRRSNT